MTKEKKHRQFAKLMVSDMFVYLLMVNITYDFLLQWYSPWLEVERLNQAKYIFISIGIYKINTYSLYYIIEFPKQDFILYKS